MAIATLGFDKYSVVQKLQNRGFSHDQAEAIADVLSEVDVSQLVTKLDLEQALHRQTWGMIGALFAQGAFVVTLLQLLN